MLLKKISLTLLAICSLGEAQPLTSMEPTMPTTPLIIAHRGASSEAPENTLSAFKRALELKTEYIELDVHLSRDGVVVVAHDEDLKRISNSQNQNLLANLSLAEIRQIDAGQWFSDDFANEPIPTLVEVLDLVWGKAGLMIEVKAQKGQEARIAQAILDDIGSMKRSFSQWPALIGSFSHKVIKEVMLRDPNQAIMGIAHTKKDVDRFLEMDVTHIAISEEIADRELLDILNAQSVRTWVYTVNQLKRAEELADNGVDGIITDQARHMKAHF